jgi:indole-3-glycerol phosphate synthase
VIDNKIFIAEIKTISPFGFKSNYDYEFLKQLSIENGDWISIHTDPLWGGHFVDIVNVKNTMLKLSKPYCDRKILAKGIHSKDSDIKRCLDNGADYVLVVGRIPPQGNLSQCLMEPSDHDQLKDLAYIDSVNRSAGLVLNRRDLITGYDKWTPVGGNFSWVTHWANSFNELKEKVKVPIYQASGIYSMNEVHPKVDGFMVGQNLPTFIVSTEINKLKEDWNNVKSNV